HRAAAMGLAGCRLGQNHRKVAWGAQSTGSCPAVSVMVDQPLATAVLLVTQAIVALAGCALLVNDWWRARGERALLWWAAALVIGSAGIWAVVSGLLGLDPLLLAIGSALGALGGAAVWK